MRRKVGHEKHIIDAPTICEKKKERKRSALLFKCLLFPFAMAAYSWSFVALVQPPSSSLSRPLFAVLGTMGSGTVALVADLQRLGLEVAHEATLGADGSVSWLHSLLYHNASTAALCSEALPQAWHPQLLFVEGRAICGDSWSCWRRRCPDALRKWRYCAAKRECPVDFASTPIILVRHPLRTIESILDFCDSPKMVAAERLLGVNLRIEPCPARLFRYWLCYYNLLHSYGQPLRREDTTPCDIVQRLDIISPRLDFARQACFRPSMRTAFWTSAFNFRRFVYDLKSDGLRPTLSNPQHSRYDRNQRPALQWTDLHAAFANDAALRADVARLALRFGYRDAEAYVEMEPTGPHN